MKKLLISLFTLFALVLNAQFPFAPKSASINDNLLNSAENAAAPITLTQIPSQFYTNNDSDATGNVTIKWAETSIALGDLYYSRFPNVASGQFPRKLISDSSPGDRQLTFNVGLDSVTTGVYFCIIVDPSNPDSTSIEFNLVIQHDKSPGNFQPDTTTNGYLSWDPSHVNTPFYHVIVSNRPVRLENVDADPNNEVVGINVVYQAITSNTFITYRANDPSGFFDNTRTPRLASGKTYYWLVFNNYGNNPALSSEIATFAEVPRFVYSNPATEQQAPQNIEPRNTGLNNLDTLTFRWNGVPGSNYHLYLYEETEQSGNVGSFLIYDTTIVTGDTSLTLGRASQLLVNSNYYWNVSAERGQFYSESDVDSFNYQNTNAGILQVHSRSNSPGFPLLARANLRIINLTGPSTNLIYLTNDSGNFDRQLTAGTYQLLVSKEGFTTVDTTIAIASGQTTDVDVLLSGNPTYFSGRIQIPGTSTVPGVTLMSAAGTDTFNVLGELRVTNQQTSEYTFRANVSAGTWTMFPFADGFQAVPGDTITRSIAFSEYQEVPILDLVEVPSRIIVNVTDVNSNTLTDVWLTFTKGLQQQTIFVPNLPYAFNAEPGLWNVRAVKEGYFSQSDNYQITVVEQQDSPLDIVMVRAGNLRGFASDENGDGLDGVRISAQPQDAAGRYAETFSTADGRYGPLLLKPGQYLVSATKNEYSSDDSLITVASFDSVTFNPVLIQNKSFVTGTIRDLNSDPVEGATVQYLLPTGGGFSAPSDSLGNYSLRVPSDQSLKLFAQKPGYSTSDTVIVTVPVNQTITRDFTIIRLSSIISGTVVTPAGEQFTPLADVQITVTDTASLQVISKDTTAADGSFKVFADQGTYWLLAEKPFFISQQRSLELNSGDSLDVEIVLLKDLGTVRGNVTLENGDPVADAIVSLRNTNTGVLSKDTTASDGKYVFSLLEPGQNYHIGAGKLRHFTSPSQGYDYTVTGGDTSGFDFTLTPAVITSIEIVDPVIKLPNDQSTHFNFKARQGTREVAIEPPLWEVIFPDTLIYTTGQFNTDDNGLFEPKSDALDAGFSIVVEDTGNGSGISERIDGFSIFARLSRNDFVVDPMRLKDHTGMVLELDSTDIETGAGLEQVSLSRLNVPESKRVSAETQSYGRSFKLSGLDNLLHPVNLTLPIPPQVDENLIAGNSRALNLGKWNDALLDWDILKQSSISTLPYFSVSNAISGSGEYTILETSRPLGIHDLKLLPNPFSPNLINRNDPYRRGMTGQVITFTLTSLDLRMPFVSAQVFNMNGELVRDLADNDPVTKGIVALIWDGKTNSGSWARNGRYFVRLRITDSTGDKEEIKSSVLIK